MKTTVKTRSRVTKVAGKVREAYARALPQIAAYAIDKMSRVADAKLRTTAHVYKSGLQQPGSIVVTGDQVDIKLVGKLPNELENGFKAFDMKPKLLASTNAKTGANGSRYVDVPFHHATSQAATRMQGMPADVKQRVDRAVRVERNKAKLEKRPMRNPLRVTGRSAPTMRTQQRVGMKPQTVRTKVGIYDDMIRHAMKVGKRTLAEHVTIRRVSSNSESHSWWHPGFVGVKARKTVSRDVRTMARAMVKRELQSIGMKVTK